MFKLGNRNPEYDKYSVGLRLQQQNRNVCRLHDHGGLVGLWARHQNSPLIFSENIATSPTSGLLFKLSANGISFQRKGTIIHGVRLIS